MVLFIIEGRLPPSYLDTETYVHHPDIAKIMIATVLPRKDIWISIGMRDEKGNAYFRLGGSASMYKPELIGHILREGGVFVDGIRTI
jgi:hypothetical protein